MMSDQTLHVASDIKIGRMRQFVRLGWTLAPLLALAALLSAVSQNADWLSQAHLLAAAALIIIGGVVASDALMLSRFHRAVWIYGLGLLAALSVIVLGGDEVQRQITLCLYPVVVIMVGLMLSTDEMFNMATLSGMLVIFLPITVNASDLMLQVFAVLLLTLTALLASQVTGELNGIVGWAEENAQRERQSNAELNEKQAALSRSLHHNEMMATQLKDLNAALEQARHQADEARHFRGQFLANMSHELRTPLNAIIGFSETMLQYPIMYDEQVLPAPYSTDLTQVYSSGQHLLQVINNILDLAKIDAGKLDMHPERVALRPLAEKALEDARVKASKKPIALRYIGMDEPPPAWADPLRTQQVLDNLLDNAVRYTERGEITLDIQSDQEALIVSVRDTGCGIAPGLLDKLFEEFQRARSQGRDGRDGSGLGLAVSRAYLTLMGGSISVESEPGEGSTFTFRLPRYALQDEPTTRPAVNQTAQSPGQPQTNTAPAFIPEGNHS